MASVKEFMPCLASKPATAFRSWEDFSVRQAAGADRSRCPGGPRKCRSSVRFVPCKQKHIHLK